MVAPILSTGIPSTEMWMQEFLSRGEISSIEKCYAGAVESVRNGSLMNLDLNLLTDEISSTSWSPETWYAALHEAAKPSIAGTGWLGMHE